MPKGKRNQLRKVARAYLKKHDVKLKTGSWEEIYEVVARLSGMTSEFRNGKTRSRDIFRRLGLIDNARPSVAGKDFLNTYAWRKVRYQALLKHGGKCQACGRSPSDGVVLNVDHIKPRKKHPSLALDIDNLQVLCGACNHGKGNWDETDWRPDEPRLSVLMGERMD